MTEDPRFKAIVITTAFILVVVAMLVLASGTKADGRFQHVYPWNVSGGYYLDVYKRGVLDTDEFNMGRYGIDCWGLPSYHRPIDMVVGNGRVDIEHNDYMNLLIYIRDLEWCVWYVSTRPLNEQDAFLKNMFFGDRD